ncbi:MAG: hypothetical protein OER85_13160, partial [Gammaproteobacteria bacterium]|nr:hypothetical protein [Gammaproteobacteria bacterium]
MQYDNNRKNTLGEVQMRKFLILAALPFMLAAVPARAQLSGSLGLGEQSCALSIPAFLNRNCGYSGGANITFDTQAGNEWIGPFASGGFYSNAAAAPGFILS